MPTRPYDKCHNSQVIHERSFHLTPEDNLFYISLRKSLMWHNLVEANNNEVYMERCMMSMMPVLPTIRRYVLVIFQSQKIEQLCWRFGNTSMQWADGRSSSQQIYFICGQVCIV